MTQTVYDVQGNPITRTEEQSDEIFSGEELDAIQICAANIDSIVSTATNGPIWLSQGQAAAAAAANSAGAAANSASGSQNSATAANASNVAAAASASASATSAQNAATAASSATASSNAAAVSAQTAEDAAASNTSNPALLPSGGNSGDTLYRDTSGTAKLGIWGVTFKTIQQMTDVNYDNAPAEGDRLTMVGGAWRPRPSNSSTTLVGLSDVAIALPADGQFLGFDPVSGKWKNRVPTGGGGGSTFIRRDANLTGPVSYPMVTADLFGFKKGNVAGGDVSIVFDGNLTCPTGQRGWGFVKLIGADGTHKVKFVAGSSGAAPAAGTFGTPIFKQVSSASSNTALTNAQNVVQNFNIPAGLKCGVAIVYCWTNSSATATDDSVSPGFIWNGGVDPILWDYHGDQPTTRIRGNLAFVYLGDIGTGGLNCSFLPQWTDYGGNGRVNAYTLAIIPYYGADPTVAENGKIAQITPAVVAIDQTCLGAGIGGSFREVCYVAGRRSSNSGDGGVVYTNATAAGTISSSPALQNGLVMGVSHEAAAAVPTDNTAHAANGAGSTAYPWIDCSFAFKPVSALMTLLTRGNKAAEMIEANQMCAWMYDQEQKIVELVF